MPGRWPLGEQGLVYAMLELLGQGGFVAGPLVAGLIALWYGLGWRALALRRGSRQPLRQLVRAARACTLSPRGVIDSAAVLAVQSSAVGGSVRGLVQVAIDGIRPELSRHRALVNTVIILAPLAGLLGTVTGMIETFDSLAEMALFTQSGGVAGGIAEALISTQMGLVVAVPGVILGRLLDRREDRLAEELDELIELVVSQADDGGEAI